MTEWISTEGHVPSEPGWYPTLTDWRTASLHPGMHRWLGAKWASSRPERIEFFSTEPFGTAHGASSCAHTLGPGPPRSSA